MSILKRVFIGIVLCAFIPTLAAALPLAWFQVGDGPIQEIDKEWYLDEEGVWVLDFTYNGSSQWSLSGQVKAKEDPYISYGISFTNNSNNVLGFTLGIDSALNPNIVGDNAVFASVSGSATDIVGDGVAVNPLFGDDDNDGTMEWQRSYLNFNTANNMGVDVGQAFSTGAGVPGQSYGIGAYSSGPKMGPSGTWTSMHSELGISLTKRDIATMNGFVTINPVPEPTALLLLGVGLAGMAMWRSRKRA
jgi:hypothetical protein